MTRERDIPELTLRCHCGTLRGKVHLARRGDAHRVRCYCDDCQAFAHFGGHPQRVLDAHGGTDILQVSPASVSLTDGIHRLACLQLAPKGLLRWHAGCCQTQLGNTLATPALPFIGIVHTMIAEAAEPAAYDAIVGPVRATVHGRYARGDRESLDVSDGVPFMAVARIAYRLLRWRLRGDGGRHPLFDRASRAPRVTPRVLEPEERSALYAAAARWPQGSATG